VEIDPSGEEFVLDPDECRSRRKDTSLDLQDIEHLDASHLVLGLGCGNFHLSEVYHESN